MNTGHGSGTILSKQYIGDNIYNTKDTPNPREQAGINCIPLLQDMPNDIAGIYFQVRQMPLARSLKVIIFSPLLAYHSERTFQERDCLYS